MGAGAVGGYYGAALAGRGHAVTFVARGEHLRALQERGLTIRSGGQATVLSPVHAVADPAEAGGGFDLVLFTVKGYDTETAAVALRPAVGPDTAVLTLQNGVDSGERLERRARRGPRRDRDDGGRDDHRRAGRHRPAEPAAAHRAR